MVVLTILAIAASITESDSMCAVDSLQSIAEGNLITNEMDWPRAIVVDTYTEISA